MERWLALVGAPVAPRTISVLSLPYTAHPSRFRAPFLSSVRYALPILLSFPSPFSPTPTITFHHYHRQPIPTPLTPNLLPRFGACLPPCPSPLFGPLFLPSGCRRWGSEGVGCGGERTGLGSKAGLYEAACAVWVGSFLLILGLWFAVFVGLDWIGRGSCVYVRMGVCGLMDSRVGLGIHHECCRRCPTFTTSITASHWCSRIDVQFVRRG
ncbi:hypothetical protein BOTBODRAFT_207415 [Botryobasidium botryosum FD-172 SS1]|uniref:Uncharacterized protein n=1 Tax=Botryobasidium botryosum (strain FD-172 SS1) TaxID=930990 RepID=A0A067N127_BOTB1|nr:hypothetical protein BOTBODRAFT_207415 [Botryobasidium botryosum FD-172 SS1]